jgi:ribosomal protein S12 methylthiotransferase accessory factor
MGNGVNVESTGALAGELEQDGGGERVVPPHAPASEPAGVVFRGVELRGVKRYFRGTHRSVPPEETLERIRPCFPVAGITRLANITGLDRIGIPTTLAIRPNAWLLSNCSGKGFTLAAALASAAMEAIEFFHVEEHPPPSFLATYEQVARDHVCPAREDLPLVRHAPLAERVPYRWSLGWDLIHQEEVAVPTSMIELRRAQQHSVERFTFQASTNGLASGNDLLEALNAALFEVIERDAVTCHGVRQRLARVRSPAVRLETIAHPLVLDLLERLRAAGMAIKLFDCTTDTGVPTYRALLFDTVDRNMGVHAGDGAHLDPEIAIVRAITEAVQCRVVWIAGSRDDLWRQDEANMKRDINDVLGRAALSAEERWVDARDRETLSTPTFHGDARITLERLGRAGMSRVIVFDLSRPGFPVKVVKVIVPGLEGYDAELYQPGRRALRFASGGAQ